MIILTESAASKVNELLLEENEPALKIRCFVTGGGCSGMQYGFDFDEEQNDDDTLIEQNGAKVLVDSMSYQYLVGATIDYEETSMGSQFVIRNPNATTSCGCGSSFAV
jgi:iron-sulfur cluster insertion protein